MANSLGSEDFAVLATVDPDAYAAGAQNSDWADLGRFDQALAIVFSGTMPALGTIDAKLQQADSAAGGNAKDITGKAITQLTGADDDKQAVINCRAEELDSANNFRFVRLVVTLGDTTSPAGTNDAMGVILGLGSRYGPASDNDLASVAEIVN